MQWLAIGLLAFMAIVFVVSFSLQQSVAWLSYVRAASEGGMVGALADWFAVTALFRYPMGIKIPHTNLISSKKDDIGEGLGSFIEENFLADEVVHEKLTRISGARMAGEWVSQRPRAEKLGAMLASAGLGALTVLDDDDVRDLIESLVRRHVIEPEWAVLIGRTTSSFVEGGHHETLIDLTASRLAAWLATHPAAFDHVVSSRLPSWVPGIVNHFVDGRLHSEAVRFTRAVAQDQSHPFRVAIKRFLADLGRDMQQQESLRNQIEIFKHEVFDSPRIRSLTATAWEVARATLVDMLEDPESDVRTRLVSALQDFGHRLQDDSTLQYKIDVWVMGTVENLVRDYRHDITNVITETVQRWDAREAAEKIELQIGKDLQFIRINGTIVGSLAGLAIYTIATLVIAPLVG